MRALGKYEEKAVQQRLQSASSAQENAHKDSLSVRSGLLVENLSRFSRDAQCCAICCFHTLLVALALLLLLSKRKLSSHQSGTLDSKDPAQASNIISFTSEH
eukprot:6076991-Amphidinium_carterae.1